MTEGQSVRAVALSGAKAALRNYDIKVAQMWFLGHSDNATFSVLAEGVAGKHLLRAHVPLSGVVCGERQSIAAIESELSWLEALDRDTDIPVQTPVRNREGRFVSEAPGPDGATPANYSLLTWVEGEHPPTGSRRTEAMAISLGELAAKLHRHAIAWEMPSGFTRPTHDWKRLQRALGDLCRVVDSGLVSRDSFLIIEETSNKIHEAFQEAEQRARPFSVIHADLNENNVLFHGKQARPIDFALCGFGYHLQDISECLLHLDGAARRVFFRGYESLCLLPEGYVPLVESFFLMNLITSFAFHAPNPAEHEWLRKIVPMVAKRFCRRHLAGESFLFL